MEDFIPRFTVRDADDAFDLFHACVRSSINYAEQASRMIREGDKIGAEGAMAMCRRLRILADEMLAEMNRITSTETV